MATSENLLVLISESYLKGKMYEYDEERQVTKPTSTLQSCRLRIEFLHSRSRSITVGPDTICRAFFQWDYFLHPKATALERERE